jgi:hypothetical protein
MKVAWRVREGAVGEGLLSGSTSLAALYVTITLAPLMEVSARGNSAEMSYQRKAMAASRLDRSE